jgi:hypothetical protein
VKRRRFTSEHGPIRLKVRVGAEKPAAMDALRILARLLVARGRNAHPELALHRPDPPTVSRRGAG